MPRAYVLINVESGSEDDVLNELKSIEGVEERGKEGYDCKDWYLCFKKL